MEIRLDPRYIYRYKYLWLGAGANLTQDPFGLGPPALGSPARSMPSASTEYFEGVKVGRVTPRTGCQTLENYFIYLLMRALGLPSRDLAGRHSQHQQQRERVVHVGLEALPDRIHPRHPRRCRHHSTC